MDSATLLDSLRLEYKIDQTLFPDAILQKYIDRAVKKISQFYPESEVSFVTTVSGQTRYTIDDDKLMKLKHVFYMQGYTPFSIYDELGVSQSAIAVPSGSYLPSRIFQSIIENEMMKKFSPQDGVVVTHNKFDLLPTPETSGDAVYYEIDRYRTLAEIPDLFEEDLIDLIFFYMGDVDAKKTVNDAKQMKYTFERRGNIQVDKDAANDLRTRRNSIMSDIERRIKMKVMSIG